MKRFESAFTGLLLVPLVLTHGQAQEAACLGNVTDVRVVRYGKEYGETNSPRDTAHVTLFDQETTDEQSTRKL